MLDTPVCTILGISHPVVLGGMAGYTSAPLVAAVSNAGGLGTIGLATMTAEQVRTACAEIRKTTDRPFGVNFLLFRVDDTSYDAALQERPPVMTLAWPRPEQNLAGYVRRARAAGSRVMVMAGSVPEARRAADAGAEIVIAQGTEGGGHVSWMGTLPLVPMVVDAVAPLPVLAAGGIADGRGLAAALALGAQGALIGTRLLASEEAPLHPNFKQAILDSDGHDTVLTEIPDTLRGQIWPGAMARAQRNGFIARWAGREWALRAALSQEWAAVEAARQAGDADNAYLLIGQDAGLIHDLPPAKVLVERMVDEAETILRQRLPALVR